MPLTQKYNILVHPILSHAQGTYNLMADTYKGKPVYVHTSGQYYMYWQDDYKNWHAWVEIGSLYAGFFAYGRNTKALNSINILYRVCYVCKPLLNSK